MVAILPVFVLVGGLILYGIADGKPGAVGLELFKIGAFWAVYMMAGTVVEFLKVHG